MSSLRPCRGHWRSTPGAATRDGVSVNIAPPTPPARPLRPATTRPRRPAAPRSTPARAHTTGRSSPGSSAFALRRQSGPRSPRSGRSSSPHSTPRPRRRLVAPPHGSWPGRRRSAGGRESKQGK
uniref:Uncharacterized protein n=1 Tax=Oryza rufipogon TaxID=4529 RepID=A0A0E0NNI3_ORYRU